jgi:hypothetical protein
MPCRRTRFQRSHAGGMARGQRHVRRRRAAGGHGAGLGAGAPHAPVDQP